MPQYNNCAACSTQLGSAAAIRVEAMMVHHTQAFNTTEAADELRPSQIVYLERADQRLYTELIQVLRDRQAGWLRPICLCSPERLQGNGITPIAITTDDGAPQYLYDLRQSSDLIWPLAQCTVALDIDAIPLLTRLGPGALDAAPDRQARQTLRLFMEQLWQNASQGESG